MTVIIVRRLGIGRCAVGDMILNGSGVLDAIVVALGGCSAIDDGDVLEAVVSTVTRRGDPRSDFLDPSSAARGRARFV